MKELILTAIITAATFVIPAFAGQLRSEDFRKAEQTRIAADTASSKGTTLNTQAEPSKASTQAAASL
jgi:hypothetical protein